MQSINSEMYYQPSGKAPVTGICISIIGGATAAVLLAILYIALQWFIPFIYFNVFISIFFGYGLAITLSFLFKKTKNRNKKTAMLIAIFIALIAFYAQWALFVSLMLNAEGSDSFYVRSSFNLNTFFTTILHPATMLNIILELNNTGTINIKHDVISGVLLWLVWLFEAMIIIVIPLLSAPVCASEPFSEMNNTWMDKLENAKHHLFVEDPAGLKAALESRNYESINLLKADVPAHDKYSFITTFSSAGDNDCYLSIENVTITVNRKNEEKKIKKAVVTYLSVPISFINKL